MTNGSHGLQTRAFDAAGNVGSSAVVSVTVSNATGGGGQLIVNGGFEGSASPWTLSGAAFWSTGGNHHSGTGYSILGASNNASGAEYQTVSIPAGHPANLTFWLNITTSESLTTAFDFVFVEVRSTSGALLGTLGSFSNRNAVVEHQHVHAAGVQPRRLERADGPAPVPGHDGRVAADELPHRRRLVELRSATDGRAAAATLPPSPSTLRSGGGMRRILAVRRAEFVVAVLTAVAVVVLGVEDGIVVAVVVSIIDHLRHSYAPRSSVLVKSPEGHWRSLPVAPGARTADGLLVYRFGSGLYFANVSRLVADLTTIAAEGAPVRWLCLDAAAVGDVDYTAAAVLTQLVQREQRAGVRVVLSNVVDAVRVALDRYGITALVGPGGIFDTSGEVLAEYPGD